MLRSVSGLLLMLLLALCMSGASLYLHYCCTCSHPQYVRFHTLQDAQVQWTSISAGSTQSFEKEGEDLVVTFENHRHQDLFQNHDIAVLHVSGTVWQGDEDNTAFPIHNAMVRMVEPETMELRFRICGPCQWFIDDVTKCQLLVAYGKRIVYR